MLGLLFPLGHWELLLVLAIVVIVFGVGKLPKVLGQLGEGVRQFRESASGKDEDEDDGPPKDNKPID